MTATQARRISTGVLPEPRVGAHAYFFVDDEFNVALTVELTADVVGWLPGDPHEPWDQFDGTMNDFDPVTTSALARMLLHAIPHEVLVAAWRAAESEVAKRTAVTT